MQCGSWGRVLLEVCDHSYAIEPLMLWVVYCWQHHDGTPADATAALCGCWGRILPGWPLLRCQVLAESCGAVRVVCWWVLVAAAPGTGGRSSSRFAVPGAAFAQTTWSLVDHHGPFRPWGCVGGSSTMEWRQQLCRVVPGAVYCPKYVSLLRNNDLSRRERSFGGSNTRD